MGRIKFFVIGVLKKLTEEYFGDTIRKEDFIDLSDLAVEIVSFTDKNGVTHRHGYRVIKDKDPVYMTRTLIKLVNRVMEVRGKHCSLNDIDVSNIEFMCVCLDKYNSTGLFDESEFDGDISGWDVSKVKDMTGMFFKSKFTGEKGIFRLEKKNRVESMLSMFNYSSFDGDLSGWDVSNVKNMSWMFNLSKFTGVKGIFKLENRNKVEAMESMFKDCPFNADISDWKVNRECDISYIFDGCPLYTNPPKWYKRILNWQYNNF